MSVTDVENAPYQVISSTQTESEKSIEIRHYDSLVLVSTPMAGDMDDSKSSPFSLLFDYISGENTGSSEIAMTAPVLSDEKQGQKIPMTAPVYMDGKTENTDGIAMMSFVLPDEYTIETAPKPTNSLVKLHEITDYHVAAITFDGRLSEENVNKHLEILQDWIKAEGHTQTGPYKSAGYNPPFTPPFLRRNEILIPIETKQQ